MADLRVNVAGVEFQNPLIAASGTFGFGHEYNEFYPLSALGGHLLQGHHHQGTPRQPAAPCDGNPRRHAQRCGPAKPRRGPFH